MDEKIEPLVTTWERFRAMRDDYQREVEGTETWLAVDTCDLLTYMHIKEERGLQMPQRAAKRLFEDETHKRVLLPPHAYELLRYIHRMLGHVNLFSSGQSSLQEYMAQAPSLSAFMKACEQMRWDNAAELWNREVWAELLKIAREQGYGAVVMVENPLATLCRLMDTGVIKPIDQIGLPKTAAHHPLADDDTVARALRELECVRGGEARHMNNLVDAQALGIAASLNEHCRSERRFFTMTTLSAASLAAYSRSLPGEAASICRNTVVSAYRKNLHDLPEANRDPLAYMQRGVGLLESVIAKYPTFVKAAGAPTNNVPLPAKENIDTLRFMADFMEYYEEYFAKLIEPVSAVPEPSQDTQELEQAYEILVDEGRFVKAMKTAHVTILAQARELAARVRPFVIGQSGSVGHGVWLGKRSLNEMFDEVVSAIERERA